MKVVTAKDAKCCSIDLARAEPVAKHGCPVIEGAGIAGDRPGGKVEGEHVSQSRPGSE